MGKLAVELKVGDSLLIGDDVRVMLEDKSGQRARLRVHAEDSVTVNVKRVKSVTNQARKGISSKSIRYRR